MSVFREDDLRRWATRQPFLPFRIQLTTGDLLDVTNGEFLIFSKNTCRLTRRLGNSEAMVEFATGHIVRIDMLNESGNDRPTEAPARGGP